MASLPFSLAPEGVVEVVGLAHVEGDDIVLEIRRLSMTKKVKDERTTTLAIAALDHIECEKGVFGAEIKLRARTIAALGDLPQSPPGQATLKLRKKDYELGVAFVREVQARVTALDLQKTNEELDAMNLSPSERELLK